MSVYQLKTFSDIYTAVMEELKIQSGDTTSLNRIKRNINTIYLDHVCADEKWKWLRKSVDLLHPAYTSDTCTVTANSRSVTMDTAITSTVKGYYFTTGDEIYKIAQHTGGSAVITLETDYVGSSSSSATGYIWTDSLPLPADCVEVEKWWIDNRTVPREIETYHKFRERVLLDPYETGAPRFGTIWDWQRPDQYAALSGAPAVTHCASAGLLKTLTFASDPSSYYPAGKRIEISGATVASYNGRFIVSSVSSTSNTITYTGNLQLTQTTTADSGISITAEQMETSDNHYMSFLMHPSQDSSGHVIHIDYIAQPLPLENDADEPLMPLMDRSVLLYGALSMSWIRERNESVAAINEGKFANKLAKMRGKLDATTDHVRFQVDKSYLALKRMRRRLPYDFTRVD